MDIYIPEKLYRLMPLLCILLALIFLFTPPGIVKVMCIVYLLGYSGYMLFKRTQTSRTVVLDDEMDKDA